MDPETENLYFVDSIQDSIGVVKRTINNQSIVRTLYFPERSEDYMLVGGMVVDHVKKCVSKSYFRLMKGSVLYSDI